MQALDSEFLKKCFSQAVFDVFSTMVGEMPDKGEPYAQRGEITGVMMLLGDHNALLSVNVSRESIHSIVSYMTGIMPEELEAEDVYDGIAELVNMIAGRAKALLAGTGYHYRLTPPLTIVGENHFIVYKKKAPQVVMDFVVGDMSLQLELTYL